MYTITYILNCIEKPEYGHNHSVDRWQTWIAVDIALVCILMSVFTFFNKLENIRTLVYINKQKEFYICFKINLHSTEK